MLFDRLRITDPGEIGRIWCQVMQQVYDYGGLYVLNLHPERGILCRRALSILLQYARNRPHPVWLARLDEIALWWKERSQFRLIITLQAPDHWKVEAICTPRATLLARHLTIEKQAATRWAETTMCVQSRCFFVNSVQCPCIGVSPHTSKEVIDFLYEQGYPAVRCTENEAHTYALYLDLPEGFGATREEQARRKIALVQQIEELPAPFLYFGCWPNGSHAALAISGDIDSVTVQDFFLRILEVRKQAS